MKYMLVGVFEREICVPKIFDTHDEALDRMCEEVSDVWTVPVEEIKESYLQGAEYNDSTCVIENAAWTERFGRNFDWKIFTINDNGEIV